MKFFLVCIVFILIYIIFYLKSNSIHLDIKSFFRKGFKKIDNQFGLFCYCGKQGKGKTYSCIKFCIEQKLYNNYIIITNVHSFNVFKDTIYIDSIFDIIEFVENEYSLPEEQRRKFLIFYDEIFTVLEKKIPMKKEILSFLSQLRKRQILFVTTAQEWSEINITFRRYVRYQIQCNMFGLPWFQTAVIFNSINDGDLIRWNNDLQDYEAPRISANFAKCNLSIIESYDTFETIQTSTRA